MPTPDNPDGCIVNCGPTQTQAPAQSPTTAQAPPTQASQTGQSPTGTSSPTSTSQPSEDTKDQPTQQDICRLVNHSAVSNGLIAYGAPPGGLADAVSGASGAWNSAGGNQITPAAGNAKPTLVIVEVRSNEKWQGQYTTGDSSMPARIEINLNRTSGLTPDQLQAVVAHEMGHALGLSDTSDPSSLMNGSGGAAPSTPQASDVAALKGLPSQAEACRRAGFTEYGFCVAGHVDGPDSACRGSQYLDCPFGRAHNGSSDTACRLGDWDDNPENLELIAELAADAAVAATVIISEGAATPEAAAERLALKEGIKALARKDIEKGAEAFASKAAAEQAAKATAEAEAQRLRQATIQQSLEYNLTDQSIGHVFGPKLAEHKLEWLVRAKGSNEAAMRAITDGIYSTPRAAGVYGRDNPMPVVVDGQTILVRGFMDPKGVFKISTAFIP
ncbi:matrixin family metalloprotease [Tsukamurella tyrosinosolvens]|uniref:matrixin family metalloprotease n=1 Tax=Tsukamurella tyrosinosolvens TaxID=57704 RepID=UPI002DD45019|nr:matrixin family metalloprotease [Tsukamurella tyrosinosolvens]MEC4616425.1 matrixin family metalloprotease [Tsukamurella tyrosinosolvens]